MSLTRPEAVGGQLGVRIPLPGLECHEETPVEAGSLAGHLELEQADPSPLQFLQGDALLPCPGDHTEAGTPRGEAEGHSSRGQGGMTLSRLLAPPSSGLAKCLSPHQGTPRVTRPEGFPMDQSPVGRVS